MHLEETAMEREFLVGRDVFRVSVRATQTKRSSSSALDPVPVLPVMKLLRA